MSRILLFYSGVCDMMLPTMQSKSLACFTG